jgi:hypothetical protein
MNILSFTEANKLIKHMMELDCGQSETYTINNDYIIIIIRNCLTTILKCVNGTINQLDNLLYYKTFKENDIRKKIENMLGNIIEKDYINTNIKIEDIDEELLHVNGSIGFINGNNHVNLDIGNDFNFSINSQILTSSDMYFIASLR